MTTPSAPRPTTAPRNRSPSFLARQVKDLAIGSDELDRLDRRGQVAIVNSRAVRGGGDGAGDRDVRKGREIVQRVAARVDDRRELAIFDARADGGGVRFVVDVDLIEMLQARSDSELLSAMVLNECREPSARSFAQLLDDLAHLVDRGGVKT